VWGRYIARFTNGPFSHVTGIVHWTEAGSLYSVGYEETHGGFGKPLKVEVERHPGRIHVYRVKDAWWNYAAASRAREEHEVRCCVCRRLCDVGWEYNWRSIWMIVRPFMPFFGLITNTPRNYERVLTASANTRQGICSQHVHRSFGECGMRFDQKPYALSSPNDIANSIITDYVCTLVPQ